MLSPLRGTEIYDYVDHLLQRQRGELTVFSRGALDWVRRLSGGLPRRINVICQNSLQLAFAERSEIVKSRHVRSAATEYDNVLAFSPKRSFRATEVARLALHWINGRGVPVVAGGLAAMAALVALVAFEVEALRLSARLIPTQSTDITQSHLSSLEPIQEGSLQGPPPIPATANPFSPRVALRPTPSAPAAEASPEQVTKVEGTRNKTSTIETQTKSSETARKILPSVALPEGEEDTVAPASETNLGTHAKKIIKYDLNRAQEAESAGHYGNAIWHLKRALKLDPDNLALRKMFLDARRAEAEQAASHPVTISSSIDIVQYEISEGDAYMRKGDYDTALRKYKVARAMDPDNDDIDDRVTNAERAQAAGAKNSP
jgi:hypothetical protein